MPRKAKSKVQEQTAEVPKRTKPVDSIYEAYVAGETINVIAENNNMQPMEVVAHVRKVESTRNVE